MAKKSKNSPKQLDNNAVSKTSKSSRSNRGLGRGLSALMSDVAPAITEAAEPAVKVAEGKKAVETSARVKTSDTIVASVASDEMKANSAAQFIAIDKLVKNPQQPRRYFDPIKLNDLTNSIREKGVLQPILARPVKGPNGKGNQHYQIVAGERRWQAAVRAGLHQMPVMIRELSDQEVLEIGVVENVQRANLNPIEEARAYKNLVDQFGRRQEDVAQAVGKSRSHVTNMMRLLTLPHRAQDLLAEGKLSAGHARAVISSPDPAALAEMIVQRDLSVREAEAMVRRLKKGEPLRPAAVVKNVDIRALEKRLTDEIGLRVELKDKNPSGKLILHYKTAEQLEDLIKRLPDGFK